MFEWLIVSSFQFVVFGSVKNDVCKTFARYKEMDDAGNHWQKCLWNYDDAEQFGTCLQVLRP